MNARLSMLDTVIILQTFLLFFLPKQCKQEIPTCETTHTHKHVINQSLTSVKVSSEDLSSLCSSFGSHGVGHRRRGKNSSTLTSRPEFLFPAKASA